VSAPWMSHTVRDLERALRVELLTRTTRTVQLTPAGQVFAGLASQILAELSSAIKTVRSMSATPHQTLKLGYTIGAGLEVVPRLLRTYHERGPTAVVETKEFDFTDPSAGLRDNLVNAAVVRPPLGLAGLVSVELATERLVACLPDDHPLAGRESLSVADVLPEPIIAAPVSPGPWRDYWILTDYRSGPAPVVAEASTLDAEMHLVSRGVGLSITSEAVGLWYKRPGVTFVPILDLTPCSVSLAWWPQDTGLIAELVAVANEVRARIAQI
jgi:DNA-binding transcriptional LysR family regulator